LLLDGDTDDPQQQQQQQGGIPMAFELDLATLEELLLLHELDMNLPLHENWQESLQDNVTRTPAAATAAAAAAHDWMMPHNQRLHMQLPAAVPISASCCSFENSCGLDDDDKQQDLQVSLGATHTAAAAAAAAAGMGSDLSNACREGSAGLSSVSHLKGSDGTYGLQCCNEEAAAAAAAAIAAECTVSPDDEVLYLFKRVFHAAVPR
jgi:hypothetical protein